MTALLGLFAAAGGDVAVADAARRVAIVARTRPAGLPGKAPEAAPDAPPTTVSIEAAWS
ncbi:MAG: hypothetical protein OEL91_07405 [Burkholderiaceae bacterium]|nr:hypothetical protein [Burkholderiaceae bacterium]